MVMGVCGWDQKEEKKQMEENRRESTSGGADNGEMSDCRWQVHEALNAGDGTRGKWAKLEIGLRNGDHSKFTVQKVWKLDRNPQE